MDQLIEGSKTWDDWKISANGITALLTNLGKSRHSRRKAKDEGLFCTPNVQVFLGFLPWTWIVYQLTKQNGILSTYSVAY